MPLKESLNNMIQSLKSGQIKYEYNTEKHNIFAQHFETCFTIDVNNKDLQEETKLEIGKNEEHSVAKSITIHA